MGSFTNGLPLASQNAANVTAYSATGPGGLPAPGVNVVTLKDIRGGKSESLAYGFAGGGATLTCVWNAAGTALTSWGATLPGNVSFDSLPMAQKKEIATGWAMMGVPIDPGFYS